MPGDFVDLALRCRTDAQNCRRTTSNLGPSSIVDDLRAKTQADRLRLQHQHVFLAIDLQRYLGLAQPLPLA